MIFRVYTIIGEQVSAMYAEWRYLNCLADQKLLAAQIALVKLDPTENAHLLHNNPGTSGLIRGDTLVLTKCVAKELTVRESVACFKEIPAFLDDQPVFVGAHTRMIVKHGIEETCTSAFPSSFKLGNDWVAFSGV